MNESEWNTIYDHLSWKDTDELIGYWQKHDQDEWTAIAFDVMEKILIERLGELPSKIEIDKPIVKMDTPVAKSNLYIELKTLIKDNDPVFFDPNKVSLLIKWVFRSLNILIFLYIIKFVFENFSLFRVLFDQNYEKSNLLIQLIFSLVVLLIVIIAIFIQYKALGYVLKTLKEIEVNSRNPGK